MKRSKKFFENYFKVKHFEKFSLHFQIKYNYFVKLTEPNTLLECSKKSTDLFSQSLDHFQHKNYRKGVSTCSRRACIWHNIITNSTMPAVF